MSACLRRTAAGFSPLAAVTDARNLQFRPKTGIKIKPRALRVRGFFIGRWEGALFSRAHNYLNINILYGIALELLVGQAVVDDGHQFAIEDVAIGVVLPVIEVGMRKDVHIEIHLIVGTHAAGIYSQGDKLGEGVVDRGFGDLVASGLGDALTDHVGARMSKFQHRTMDAEPLLCGFEAFAL